MTRTNEFCDLSLLHMDIIHDMKCSMQFVPLCISNTFPTCLYIIKSCPNIGTQLHNKLSFTTIMLPSEIPVYFFSDARYIKLR